MKLPCWPTLLYGLPCIISESHLSLRNTHHLWFAQGRVESLVPAGTSLTSHSLQLVLAKLRSLTWVLVSRGWPREPRTPRWVRGGRQAGQRRAKQKHNLASPLQTAHLLSASIWATAHNSPILILMTANSHKYTKLLNRSIQPTSNSV